MQADGAEGFRTPRGKVETTHTLRFYEEPNKQNPSAHDDNDNDDDDNDDKCSFL
jgi:hypothetical protein